MSPLTARRGGNRARHAQSSVCSAVFKRLLTVSPTCSRSSVISHLFPFVTHPARLEPPIKVVMPKGRRRVLPEDDGTPHEWCRKSTRWLQGHRPRVSEHFVSVVNCGCFLSIGWPAAPLGNDVGGAARVFPQVHDGVSSSGAGVSPGRRRWKLSSGPGHPFSRAASSSLVVVGHQCFSMCSTTSRVPSSWLT